MPSINTDNRNAITQTFRISTPEGVTGMFATKIDLFFKKKSTTFGVELYITELTNGLPDPDTIKPASRVLKSSEDVNVSNTAATATTFTFQEPVFLENDKRYAFVVKPVSNNPDYEIWTGKQGEKDITTGVTIASNPLSEKAYFGKNSDTWAELPNSDIKFKLYRAKFTSLSGNAVLKNSPQEVFILSNVRMATGSTYIQPGDELYGWVDGLKANTSQRAVVQRYDSTNNLMFLNSTTGNFANTNAVVVLRTLSANNIVGAGIVATATIDEVYDFPVHALSPAIGLVVPSFTDAVMSIKGTYKSSNTPVADSAFTTIDPSGETDFFDVPRYMQSKSNEANNSLQVAVSMTSDTDFLSPVIDLKKDKVIAIRNAINNVTTGETTNYGKAESRYISKTITLAEGMDAEDLKVYITAYKPPHTNFLVYTKVWNSEDPQKFEDKLWTPWVQVNDSSFYCDPKNPEDYREFEFRAPELTAAQELTNTTGLSYIPLEWGAPGEVWPLTYSNAGTSVAAFVGFKKYAIKVVLTAEPGYEYMYPRINDVRAIAIQL